MAANLPIAPQEIRNLRGLETRIADKTRLFEDLMTISNALGGPIDDHIQMLMRRSVYTVQCILQAEDEASKFPQTRNRTWAYYGLPLQQVADGLGMTRRTLARKGLNFDGHAQWPVPSTHNRVRICAQSWNTQHVSRALLYPERGMVFGDVRNLLLQTFVDDFPNGDDVRIYMEIEGIRRGPIANQQDWQVALARPENVHRVSLYLTNFRQL